AARIALQVASALEHARRNGLMHRDIKPENILITTDGVVKVADFGLSRALAESRATQANVLMGTAAYLAPEQVQGETVDHRADIYSLGIVLVAMLTGKLPFRGDSPVVAGYKPRAHHGEQPAGRGRQKRDLRRPRWLALLLLLSVVAATIYVISGRTPSVAVPGVVNLSQADATAALTARDFKVATQTEFNATVP